MRRRRCRGGREVSGRAYAALVISLTLLSMSTSGCSRVRFRLAMGEVQRKYVELFDRVEAGMAAESREAAVELKRALQDDAITESNRFSREEDFPTLLQDTLDSLDDFAEHPEEQDAERLLVLRGDVWIRCSSCHDRFKAP